MYSESRWSKNSCLLLIQYRYLYLSAWDFVNEHRKFGSGPEISALPDAFNDYFVKVANEILLYRLPNLYRAYRLPVLQGFYNNSNSQNVHDASCAVLKSVIWDCDSDSSKYLHALLSSAARSLSKTAHAMTVFKIGDSLPLWLQNFALQTLGYIFCR